MASKPNILFFHVDNLGMGELGCYGGGILRGADTKRMDSFSKQGVKLTYLPFIMKAMVAALRQYPILNSMLDEEKGEIVYKHYYNIGLSVQTEDGLTAPVINAERVGVHCGSTT